MRVELEQLENHVDERIRKNLYEAVRASNLIVSQLNPPPDRILLFGSTARIKIIQSSTLDIDLAIVLNQDDTRHADGARDELEDFLRRSGFVVGEVLSGIHISVWTHVGYLSPVGSPRRGHDDIRPKIFAEGIELYPDLGLRRHKKKLAEIRKLWQAHKNS
jgi:predicted nucleotidyltransferase